MVLMFFFCNFYCNLVFNLFKQRMKIKLYRYRSTVLSENLVTLIDKLDQKYIPISAVFILKYRQILFIYDTRVYIVLILAGSYRSIDQVEFRRSTGRLHIRMCQSFSR